MSGVAKYRLLSGGARRGRATIGKVAASPVDIPLVTPMDHDAIDRFVGALISETIERPDALTLPMKQRRADLNGMLAYIDKLESEVLSWKRRAEQHGCNTVDGDKDCG